MNKIIKATASTTSSKHLHVETLHLRRQRQATINWLSSAAQSTLQRCWKQRLSAPDERKR